MKRRSQHGYIFLTTLLIVTGLVVLMTILATDQRAASQYTQNQVFRRRSEMAAQSAVAYAMGTIGDATTTTVTLNDAWAQLGTADGNPGDEEFDLGDSTFRFQVIDANSLVDINGPDLANGTLNGTSRATNTAALQQIQTLPLTQQQVDCYLDWIQPSLQARSDGAKDSFYNGLTTPYNTKLAPLTTLNELLLIDNWTGALLYTPQTNTVTSAYPPQDASGNMLPIASILTVDCGGPPTGSLTLSSRQFATSAGINLSKLTRAQQRAIEQSTSFSGLFRALTAARVRLSSTQVQNILQYAKLSNGTHVEGKLNLNTVTESALMTLPNMSQPIATAIVAQQGSTFTSLGQLATVPGMTTQLVEQLADDFTVGSDTWIVRAYGQCGGVTTAAEVTVRMVSGTPQIVTWTRLNDAAVPSWWDWQYPVNTTTEVEDGL